MPSGARAAPDSSMISAVFDTNLLVSAFLSGSNRGGVSNELLRFVVAGAIDLSLSVAILDEMVETLLGNERMMKTYRYSARDVGQYRADLMTLAAIVDDPPSIAGAVPRDPDDDKIVACAVGGGAAYIVTRDQDLLSLGTYQGVAMIAPEEFIHLVRRNIAEREP
jgi:putative PIN family toxin of toxin-antitoxin system